MKMITEMRPSIVRSVLAAALLSAAAPMPVQALQQEFSTKETRALMHAYSKCVVERQAKKASEALLENADNGTILRKYRQLISGECLARQTKQTSQMKFGGDLYRYALADALVARELAGAPVLDFSAVPRLDHRDPGEAPSETTKSGKRLGKAKYDEALRNYRQSASFSYLSRYGECVVRVAPSGAKALLLTAPDSSEENARFRELGTALATCLPPGETLRFGRVVLRGTIAINYYRLSHAARRMGARAAQS
jgi:hypothetical protein